MSSTYIQDTKYQINLFKIIQNSPENIQKIGISIYKLTLEINTINNECIDLFLNSNLDFIESKVNIGFIDICGVPCFLFACNNDIKEKGKIDGKKKSKVYKIKNIHFIPLNKYLNVNAIYKVENEFKRIKKFLIGEGLYFCDDPIRFDIDIIGQLESFQSYNFKYKIFEDFQYNYDFAQNSFKSLLTPFTKGYYTTIHYINTANEKGDINIAMRNKIFENNKNLIEIEIFIPPSQNNPKTFQNIFYAYINELDDKTPTLKNLLDGWIINLQHKESDEKYGLIINFQNKKNDINDQEIPYLSSNFDVINLNKINGFQKFFEQLTNPLKEIGYNYKWNNIEYNSQNRLLILIQDDFKNFFLMVKCVTTILLNIFLKDRNYKNTIINDINDELSKKLEKAEKKLKIFNKDFPKRIELNTIYERNIGKINKTISVKRINPKFKDNYNIINQNGQSNTNNNSFNLFIGTYNVNALDSYSVKTVNLEPFLFPNSIKSYFDKNNFPIFYCIGLEETVELNPKNILINPKNRVEVWEERITSELQKKYNYFLLCKDQLVGILLLFFVKSSEIKYIRNIHIEKLKSGFMGCGNKGCCFLNFQYKSKKFGFCSCHLPAGQKEKNLINRKGTFNQILDFRVGKSEEEFKKNDFYFIFGDLNFRTKKIGLDNLKNHIKIISSNKEAQGDFKDFRKTIKINDERSKMKVMKKLKSEIYYDEKKKSGNSSDKKYKENNNNKNNITIDYSNYFTKENINLKDKENRMDESTLTDFFFGDFLDSEELTKFKKSDLLEFGIEEGEIKFPPTYKYVKKTNSYNISKKVPSWTDRILYKSNEKLKMLLYDRININLSDHKPVVGFFEINNW